VAIVDYHQVNVAVVEPDHAQQAPVFVDVDDIQFYPSFTDFARQSLSGFFAIGLAVAFINVSPSHHIPGRPGR
jgi:hypothetical protein